MIIKHVSSKSSNYKATQEYMEHEHDKNGKTLLDENGQPQERFYICDTLNVENRQTWASECKSANDYYSKNQGKNDIKQHQYILSFSPEESASLTPQEVMQIGKEWTQENLPGHQAILYVHQDGHNESGNLHVHVNINSVRLQDVPQQDWMNGQAKHYKEGMKHTQTAKELYSMRESLEQITQQHNLNMTMQQRTGKHIDDKEYYAKLRGEQRTGTTFDTQKEELRACIEATVPKCMENGRLNEDKFIREMQERYNVTVTESRGRFSYMHPEWERKRPVSDRKLGDDYRKENIIHGFSRQENRTINEGRVTTESFIRSARASINGADFREESARAESDYRKSRATESVSERADRNASEQRQRAEKSRQAQERERTAQSRSQKRSRGLHL